MAFFYAAHEQKQSLERVLITLKDWYGLTQFLIDEYNDGWNVTFYDIKNNCSEVSVKKSELYLGQVLNLNPCCRRESLELICEVLRCMGIEIQTKETKDFLGLEIKEDKSSQMVFLKPL